MGNTTTMDYRERYNFLLQQRIEQERLFRLQYGYDVPFIYPYDEELYSLSLEYGFILPFTLPIEERKRWMNERHAHEILGSKMDEYHEKGQIKERENLRANYNEEHMKLMNRK